MVYLPLGHGATNGLFTRLPFDESASADSIASGTSNDKLFLIEPVIVCPYSTITYARTSLVVYGRLHSVEPSDGASTPVASLWSYRRGQPTKVMRMVSHLTQVYQDVHDRARLTFCVTLTYRSSSNRLPSNFLHVYQTILNSCSWKGIPRRLR